MEATIKKTFILKGLCCPHCAMEIEKEIGALEGVSSAAVDFTAGTLTVELSAQSEKGGFPSNAEAIVKSHDPAISMHEKNAGEAGRKILYLAGLDCAGCARKIEERVAKMEGVKSASLDFVSGRLTIDADGRRSLPALAREASALAREIEPDVKISHTPGVPEKSRGELAKKWARRLSLCAGALLFAVGMLVSFPFPAKLAVFLASFLLIGGEVVFAALRNLAKGWVFDENFLMSVATIGAFAIGEYPEGVAVMLFYQVGEAFQRLAVNRSRRSITALMDIKPDFANLLVGDEARRVAPEEVGVGDLILVRPGERVPLDGRVVEGYSALDTSALTGEALPRDVGPESDVLSGSVNKSGVLTVEVAREFGESTVSKILDLVQNAGSKKAPAEAFITKFARYYTPAVTLSALLLALLPPLLIPGASFREWIYRALSFLVVSCPCALVISIPLTFFGGIGGASRNGILVKGSNFLEALNDVDTVVFDKTGTLTKGNFRVVRVSGANGRSDDELLALAAHAESFSNHPIALSVRAAYGREVDPLLLSEREELPGQGVRALFDGRRLAAGNARLMEAEGVPIPPVESAGTAVHVALDGAYAGSLVIADEIKPDAAEAVRGLKDLGVRKTVMLTGDSDAVGRAVGRELGLDEVYTELLPDQKVGLLEQAAEKKNGKGKIIFVGDGMNDAPVLARADVGVAMGAMGSDAAIEAADVVLMTDEPSKLPTAIRLARRTRAIVWQNIVFAIGVKVAILLLAAVGVATMWEAVFGDVGVAVIAIINAMRAMKTVKAR